MKGMTSILIILVSITLHLTLIGFILSETKKIEEIRLCKDNPTLILDRTIRDCNCKEILKKYNIKINGK